MGETVYIEVQANSVSTYANGYSAYDTTSGYYISYVTVAGEGGGFTGTGWYLEEDCTNDPFQNYQGISSEEDIIALYNQSGGNLTSVFSTWIERVGEVAVSNFCNMLMNNTTAYNNGCITMLNPGA